jgi:hypothetical protein
VIDDSFDYLQLNPAIRSLVQLLRTRGFDTTDSGDGTNAAEGMEGALEFPHVHCVVSPDQLVSEAHRMANVLAEAGIVANEGTIQATYDPANRGAILSVYGVTLLGTP